MKNIFQRLIGHSNESRVTFCGIDANALVDSGSQITTITEEFYNSLSPRPHLWSLEELDLNLKVQGAGGHDIPYIGCILADVQVPFMPNCTIKVGVLVVPATDYGLEVPIILGTNVISRCRRTCDCETAVPDNWKNAFAACHTESAGIVKSTIKVTIKLKPNDSITLSGMVRNCRQIVSAVTETAKGVSSRLGVCPRVVKLDPKGKNQRVPVKIFNVSAREVQIEPRTPLCELQEVQVLRNLEFASKENTVGTQEGNSDNGKAQCCQQSVKTDKNYESTQPSGIDLSKSALDDKQKDEMTRFLLKWKHMFSTDITDLGNCDLFKHRINLTDNEPFKEPHRRIPPALFQEVREHILEMLEAGAIRPSKSPYSSNVVIVRKKDGTIRFCVDFRKLNSKIIKDAYAIPRPEETLHLLVGAKYFTKLDLRSGYWQVEIEEEDKPKTAFQVGTLGFYEFHRMPFGLCNAPATFQRLMEMCMGDMNLRDCLVYLDDIIIFSSSFEEHIDRLTAVFSRLQEHNLKLKASKCEFMMSQVTYLGHIVSQEGIQTDPENTSAIRDWPVPQNIKDVRSFLGFTGYYRRFIQNFARIARPLNHLLIGHETFKKTKGKKKTKVKKVPFVWEEAQQKAFDTLKEKLTNPPILAYADNHLPFKLHTDASSTGLGAVLYQRQDGQDRVVCYASRSLKPSEKNYPAHKLEYLALKWSVTEKFHDYLYGTSFEVYTDNYPLTYVFSTAKLDATGHRWLADLFNYNFTITYRSGRNNADADGLSRISHKEETTTVFPDVLKAICQSMTIIHDPEPFVDSLVPPNEVPDIVEKAETSVPDNILLSTALTAQDWQKAQAADSDISYVMGALLEGYHPSPQQAKSNKIDLGYLPDWDKYSFKDGVLYKSENINGEEVNRLVLPVAFQEVVLKSYHDDLGHQGRDRTASLIKCRFLWPRMNQFIRKYVQKCGRCICRKAPQVKSAHLVNITSSAPMELVCIDYLSLERSKGGFENILVITDHFSRYAQAIPTRNKTAQTTAKVLFENFFVHYGFPAKLHSDKGANFESKVIRKLCNIAGIQKSRTTPYHPMGNGMVERFNRTLLNMLGTMSEKQKPDWKSHVPTLTHAYNAAMHESTGFSPFFLMFGRHPRWAIDAFLGIRSSEERKSNQDYADKLKNRLSDAYKCASEEAAHKGEKYKHYYDTGIRHSVLEAGDRVFVKKVGIKSKHKLADIWESTPYVVISQLMPDIPLYMVKKENSTNKPKPLHRNMLLPFNALPSSLEEEPTKPKKPTHVVQEETYTDSSTDSSADEDDEQTLEQPAIPRYIIPQKRSPPCKSRSGKQASASGSSVTPSSRPVTRQSQSPVARGGLRRSQRNRRAPQWMHSGQWQIGMRPHTFRVNQNEVIYL